MICIICGNNAFKPVTFYANGRKCNKPRCCLFCIRKYIKSILESHIKGSHFNDDRYEGPVKILGTFIIPCPHGCCKVNRPITLCSVLNYEPFDFTNCYRPTPWREQYTSEKPSEKLNMTCSICSKICNSFENFRKHNCKKDAYDDIFNKFLNEDIKRHVSRFLEQQMDDVIPKTSNYMMKFMREGFIHCRMISARV